MEEKLEITDVAEPLKRNAALTRELLSRANIDGTDEHDFNKFPSHMLKKLRKAARAQQRKATCAAAVSSNP